jgi:hypothetical protein
VDPHLCKGSACVFKPLLTGLEGDGDTLTDAVTLETHTRDVVTLLEREALCKRCARWAQLCGNDYHRGCRSGRRLAAAIH